MEFKATSNQLSVSKTARYYTAGTLDKKTKTIWFVCHGYGQLAKYFIQNFKVLDNGENFIVAPEALSRFYLQGFSGRVGATWMTKEDRENDIKDYNAYLSTLYKKVMKDIPLENVKINILGFSQGVSTVCRWVVSEKIKFDKL